MKKLTLFLMIFIFSLLLNAQNYFRSGMFLHHSTGNYIWGPNPGGNSTTTIPLQMHIYNIQHSLTQIDSVSMEQEWWTPSDNEWSTQDEFFHGNQSYTNINDYLSNYKILVIKSCFPSSSIDSWGQASDTLNPTYKSVYNYKWHWRRIISIMKNHPQNFFAIWTNAPLEINSTNASEANLSKLFCKWAKDTLAKGLDPVFGAFPPNVYVFDYFSKLTDANGYELTNYRTSSGDSHPNGAATDFIAPQFVNEIFNAAIAYESYSNLPDFENSQNIFIYPNPASNVLNFKFISASNTCVLSISNSVGQLVYSQNLILNSSSFVEQKIDISNFAKGIYFFKIRSERTIETQKFIIK